MTKVELVLAQSQGQGQGLKYVPVLHQIRTTKDWLSLGARFRNKARPILRGPGDLDPV